MCPDVLLCGKLKAHLQGIFFCKWWFHSHQSQIKPVVADIYKIAESGANYHNSPVLYQILKSTWKREREITQNNSKGRQLKIKVLLSVTQ